MVWFGDILDSGISSAEGMSAKTLQYVSHRGIVIKPDILQHSIAQLFPFLRREVHDSAVSSSAKVSMLLSTAQLSRWRDCEISDQLEESGMRKDCARLLPLSLSWGEEGLERLQARSIPN